MCEANKAKYPDTTDEALKDKITTGMNGGGVGWLREKRVAETLDNNFVLDLDKIKAEAKSHCWDISGEAILADYNKHMQP